MHTYKRLVLYLLQTKISVAMAEWHLCTNMLNAVDNYDLLGVRPGPDESRCTPLQRIMRLSTVPEERIDECYRHTIEAVGMDSAQAKRIISAYSSLQGDARSAYDAKLLAAASVTWHYNGSTIFYLHLSERISFNCFCVCLPHSFFI